MEWLITTLRRLEYLLVIVLVALSMTFITSGRVLGADDSGLSLEFYWDPDYPDNLYPLSDAAADPIKLIMVLKNISNEYIYMEQGFSKVELHRYLLLTDPCKSTLEVIPQAGEFSYDAPPPPFLNGQPAVPAEILRPDYVKSLTIEDLRQLFPLMKKLPGVYYVESQIPGTRFVVAKFDRNLTLLGVANHEGNWSGTINAAKMQLSISPLSGGHLKARIEKNNAPAPKPLFQIPVKAFKTSDIPDDYTPADTWVKIEPVLTGTTDDDGQVAWDCDKCVPVDDYTIIAYYINEYKESRIAISDGGWNTGCSGVTEKSIYFGEPVVSAGFSVFAFNSIWLRTESVILSGNIGAQQASPGPWLNKSKAEVYIDKKAQARSGVRIYGDSVRIEKKAVVFDVYYNELENKGQILGEMITPLELPVWEPPVFLESSPGKKDVKVKGKKGRKGKKDKKDDGVVELAAGAYGKVEIGHNGELRLVGGTYHFKSMKLDKDASLICLNPTTILIEQGLEGHDEIYIGPGADSGISAADIVLYIGGIEEKKGKKKKPKPKVKKVVIGKKSRVMANIYAPGSTLEIQKECEIEGSFIARDVIVDEKVKVKLDSAF